MGFMDKLKGAVKAVTGGSAKVEMDYPTEAWQPGQSMQIRITITSTVGDMKTKGVFVDVRAEEVVNIDKKASQQLEESLRLSRDTFTHTFQIAPEFVLGGGETQTFEGEIALPENVQPSYNGKFTQHKWSIRGRLDVRGNDPDTGFKPLRVGLR